MSFADENRRQYHRLHKGVLLLGWILVPVIFVLEIILLITGTQIQGKITNYFVFLLKMFLPTIINFLVMIAATVILNAQKIGLQLKNWCSTFVIFIICSMVAIIHRNMYVAMILPCFALLFSTIFANGILTTVVTICSGIVMSLSLGLVFATQTYSASMIVSYISVALVVFVFCVLISSMMVKNAMNQRALIYGYCSNQEELIDELQVEPMTGLGNRTSLNECLLLHMQKYHNGECIPHLVLMDIDHFKDVNDTYGHNAGDVVIKNLAAIIRKNMKGIRRTFRFGGDEMVLIFGKESLDEIKQIIENIRTEFKSTKYNFHPDHQITISVGCAPFYKGLNQKTWFELADAVMYKSKEGGRDTVSFADE